MTEAEKYTVIKNAILNKRQIIADYNGCRREMCPHAIGRNKDGRVQALFYQFGGESNGGLGPIGSEDNWQCIPLSGLSNITAQDGAWQTAPKDTRPQTCVNTIDVQVTC